MKHPRILILRLSSIGDILLTTAFIRQVRSAFPAAQIDFVIKEQFSELLEYNPHIDNIYKVRKEDGLKDLLYLRGKIFSNPYNFVFDLHNNFRTRILTLGHSKSTITKNLIKRWLLVGLKINLFRVVKTIPEKYLGVATKAGIADDGLGLEAYWAEHDENRVAAFLKEGNYKNEFVALAPGAMHYTKRWPAEYFTELIQKILTGSKQHVLLLGSAHEAPLLDQLVSSDRVINVAGNFSIIESAILLSKAKGLVSNDSGLMHLATAVRTPVVAIFGSTVEELGFFPYRGKSAIVENKNLNCRPCSHVGKKACPKKHFKCMQEILPDTVYNELQRISVN